MLVLSGVAIPARAETDLTLTTRFIQGSFDVLLPDGWVVALTAEGRAMEAQSPERHKLSLSARVRNDEDLARAEAHHLDQLRKSELLDVTVVEERRLLDGRLLVTVVRPSFNEKSRMGDLLGPDHTTRHILASYRGEGQGLWLSAGLIVYGEEAVDERWIEFLATMLESARVPRKQSRGGPLYRRVKGAPPLAHAEVGELVGTWRTRNILGTATFAPTSPKDIVLADIGLEELTLSVTGHYESQWRGVFSALEGGDLVSRESEHRENGSWSVREGLLLLVPRQAEGRSFEDKKAAGAFLPAPTPPRSYEVILRDGRLVLRGVCPAFAQMQYCEDLYTGGSRVLDFILEPNDGKS
jgi:hypothetical protein